MASSKPLQPTSGAGKSSGFKGLSTPLAAERQAVSRTRHILTDLDTLTSSRAWAATPEDYNSLNLLTFCEDGSGRLVLGYGQAIFANVTYRFEIPSPGILRLTYVDAVYFKRGGLGRRLLEATREGPRELRYALSMGEFRGQMNMGSENGPFTYHYQSALMLDRPPYPEATVLPVGHLPSAAPYESEYA